uniref:Protein JTB n=1 Tax=Petromyzon marinus TaxID=7757 RepID=A0AAJ7WLD2_PETMA|nr:protein JTB-like [Petromyzon marinus]
MRGWEPGPLLLPLLLAAFGAELGLTRVADAASVRGSLVAVTPLPCWALEEYRTVQPCTPCSDFQSTAMEACVATGFVEKLSCVDSHKDEFRSCRSVTAEERAFWRFELVVVGVGAVLALAVTLRHRRLDRIASDKVRRQIESL